MGPRWITAPYAGEEEGGAPAVIGAVTWGLLHPQLVAVREARKLITVDVAGARIDLFGGDDDPTRVWWPTDTMVEPSPVTAEEIAAGAVLGMRRGSPGANVPLARRGHPWCDEPVSSKGASADRRGALRCLVAAALFGATAPLAAELATSVPTFTLAGLLYVGAALAVTPSVLRRPPTAAALRQEWRPVAVAVVAGGAIGPLLLVAGLARTNAATGSILLNTELAATVLVAAVVFREHLGARLLWSAALITAAGVLLTWEPGAAIDSGALLIIAACVAWGLDNGVTARIEQLAPEHVVALKGVVAGGTNLVIGLAAAGIGPSAGSADVAAALALGAVGYGASITLWVKGARDLGAARAQVAFAIAPFIGATIAWLFLDAPVEVMQLVAVVLAAAGVAVSLRSGHEHDHAHEVLEHEHDHTHDDGHHDHVHRGGFAGRHSHRHRHEPTVHRHSHVPDLHHAHRH